MTETGLNEQEGMRTVTLPSGATWPVHESELAYFRERSKRYLKDNDFVNISDLQDVDRLLSLELLCFRWANWISAERDYWGDTVESNNLQKALKDHSGEVRQLKKSLGLDRDSREKARGEDSVDMYLSRLRQRAQHFGYMRNQQANTAIELFQELKGIITLHLNCDEIEQVEQKCRITDVLKWLVDEAFPQFDKIDADFRAKEQVYWIREQ